MTDPQEQERLDLEAREQRAAELSARHAALLAAPGDQPPPVHNDGQSVHQWVADEITRLAQEPIDHVIVRDLLDRVAVGLERYGTPLQAGNGRDPVWDGYQEALDGLAYAGQLTLELGAPADAIVAVLAAQLEACRAWAGVLNSRSRPAGP